MLFFQLLANYTQHLVAIFKVQRAGGGRKPAKHRVYHPVFVLERNNIGFEDADHVPYLNNFTQNSHPAGKRAYTRRIIIYT